jgi:hypothetical protein
MRDYRHYFSAMFWHNYCIMFFMMRCGYIEVTVNLGEADKKRLTQGEKERSSGASEETERLIDKVWKTTL